MKHFILSLGAATILLAACNSNKTKETTTDETKTDKSATEMTSPETTGQAAVDDAQKKIEEMKKLPALTTDQIKAMLPAELNGIKRSSFSANSMMGYAVGEAKYKADDGKEMSVMIWDCAGEAGVGIYNLMYWGAMNMEQEDENGYKKSVTFEGRKAIESFEKNQDKYAILFTSGDRLLVNVEGEKMGLDAVKQAAKSLELKTN